MAILVDKSSRVLVQGITGREGSFHTRRMLAAGTAVVAGTSPNKAGETMAGVPVFGDAAAAVRATGADVAVQFVPAGASRAALLEAAEAGVRVVVCVTEGIPVHDMMAVTPAFERRGVQLVGPNCPGLVLVGGANVGIMPADIFTAGPVGIVSRSGTLTYQIVNESPPRRAWDSRPWSAWAATRCTASAFSTASRCSRPTPPRRPSC